ncbi:hypothetical protein BH11MYX4_BH11MYX4_27570 [soil metagenome]
MGSVREQFVTSSEARLDGDVDLEATVAAIPAHFTTKGMFFKRYVAALGAEWEELVPSLREPARHGRYHAFEGYPMRDYVRVFDRVARARFPGSTREAFRLLARGEVEVFAHSTLGKVMFSLLRDPGGALLRYPEILGVMVRGPEISAERLGERRIAVTHPRYHGAIEQGLGLVEGFVQTFDEEPRVAVSVDPTRRVVFDVSW